jgi:hypothetical protein
MTLFILEHLAALLVLLLAAAGAGRLAAGSRFSLPLRAALGLALLAQALFLLAAIGQLRTIPIVVLIVVAIAAGKPLTRPPATLSPLRGARGSRGEHAECPSPRSAGRRACPERAKGVEGCREAADEGASTGNWQLATLFAALFLLALSPPLAFDETLYHLPFVRALAASGQLRFLTDMRFPVFPQLQEMLCVPMFLFVGDTATHLVSLAEVLITAALLLDWGERAGWLAAALFLGSPIVMHLATVGYVDAALTLFVTAGFYCLDRRRPALAGIFLGTACSVKYLGGYFAVAALVIVVCQRSGAWKFVLSCVAAALPTTLWLIITTRNPVFPFFGTSAWSMSLPAVAGQTRIVRTLRLIWDVTFARGRVNWQPPVTPLLAAAVIVVLAAALRDARARVVAFVCAAYLVVFAFLPQDSRYLVPLLPLLSIAAATAAVARWPKIATWMAWIAVAPGIAYVVYRLALQGIPPATPDARAALLAKRIPEYAALTRADDGTVYVCGGEQLKYYARGRLLGDFIGPYSYQRVLAGADGTAAIAERLRRIDARYFLVARRACAPPRPSGGMDLVYEDGAAQLWRVQRTQSAP